MCRATLLPEPDSPLTMISRIDTRAPCSTRQSGLDHVLGVMIGGLFLVVLDASIELVGQCVDGGVHIGLGCIGVDFIPSQHESRFGLVTEFLHREHAVDIDQLFEMPGNAFKFLEYISA